MLAGTMSCCLLTTLFIVSGPTKPSKKVDPPFQLISNAGASSNPMAGRFDFPLGTENGALAHNASALPIIIIWRRPEWHRRENAIE